MEELNLTLDTEKSITFKYRIVVGSGVHFGDDQLNSITEDFAKLY
jgi:hypothetical protein